VDLIKQLIKTKGLTQIEVAKAIGVGYHSFEKMVIKAPYVTKRGEVKFRECRHIREKLASWLGYPYELIWGPDSDIFLKKLIAEEIRSQVETETDKRIQALGIL